MNDGVFSAYIIRKPRLSAKDVQKRRHIHVFSQRKSSKVYGVNALLTLIVNDELGSLSRMWNYVIRGHVGDDKLQLDDAGVRHQDDLLTWLATARRHAVTTGAVSYHRHVVA